MEHDSKHSAVCSRWTEGHKTQGQRAGSDILGGNEFEIEVDFISACCSTYLEEKAVARSGHYWVDFNFCRLLKAIFTLLMPLNVEGVLIYGN